MTKKNVFNTEPTPKLSDEAHAELKKGYSLTAYALRTNTTPLPANPHPVPALAADVEGVERYGAWKHGQEQAISDYGHWNELTHSQKTHFSRAADAAQDAPGLHTRPVVLNGDAPQHGAEACRTGWKISANPWPTGCVGHEQWKSEWNEAASKMWQDHIDAPAPPSPQPETVTRAIYGNRQASQERQTLVNEAKLLEADVLGYIASLRDGIANEMGELAKELAEYQANGYQRLSVEEQTARMAAFKERDRELNEAARWLGAGKTSIEVGFMEVNRSTFRPGPVAAKG